MDTRCNGPAAPRIGSAPLLTDPQISGGLRVRCSAEAAESVLQAFRSAGFDSAAVVGQMQASAGEQGVSLACF